METIILEKYLSFQCLAGACTSTCCAGWEILVDEQDYGRFKKIKPEWLRKDILENIQKKNKKYYFKNDRTGRCAMLDADGLCRIQRNTSEKLLCNTCRKYPRLINSIAGQLYISMAASCPVISEYLTCDSVVWLEIDETGKRKKVFPEERKLTKGVWELYQNNYRAAKEIQKRNENHAAVYACFEKLADGVLDIILRYRVQIFEIEIFDVMEENYSEEFAEFLDLTAKNWKVLVKNYLLYRILSRKTEYPEETDEMCLRQILGELFLLRMLSWCNYKKTGVADAAVYAEFLQKVYRFSAHGKKVSEAFQDFLASFFSQDILWNYVIL